MSVRVQSLLRDPFVLTQQLISEQLRNYQQQLAHTQSQIARAINHIILTHQQQNNQHLDNIQQLSTTITNKNQENSNLRTQLMALLIKNQQLADNHMQLKEAYELKEEAVKELAEEIQSLRQHVLSLRDEREDEVVSFDDPQPNRYQLQTINQVSEHDMSMSFSMGSIHSYNYQQIPADQTASRQKIQDNEQYKVNSYQDALSILKHYNNQGQTPMPRQNKIHITQAKQNIPQPNNTTTATHKPNRNGTIDKLKKMRRIQSLELDTEYNNSKGDILEGKIHKSPLQQQPGFLNEGMDVINGGESIGSTRIRSQEIVTLWEQMKTANSAINHINNCTTPNHTHHQPTTQPNICKINYAQNYHYHGSYDTKQLPSGYGKLYKKGEIVYQGEWRAGKMHGWGKLVLSQPKELHRFIIHIDGNFRQGSLEGTSVCLFNTGEKFMGSITKGQIEHEGTFVSQKGILTGHWQGSCLVLLI